MEASKRRKKAVVLNKVKQTEIWVCTDIVNSIFKKGNCYYSSYSQDSLVKRLTLVCEEFEKKKVLKSEIAEFYSGEG